MAWRSDCERSKVTWSDPVGSLAYFCFFRISCRKRRMRGEFAKHLKSFVFIVKQFCKALKYLFFFGILNTIRTRGFC
jgi:hypothetical protein